MSLIANNTPLTLDTLFNSALFSGFWVEGDPHVCTGAESYADIAAAKGIPVSVLLAHNDLPPLTDVTIKPRRGTPLHIPSFDIGTSVTKHRVTDMGGSNATSSDYAPVVAIPQDEEEPAKDIPRTDNRYQRDGFLAETRHGTAQAVSTQLFRVIQTEWAVAARVTYMGPADPYLQSLSPEYKQKLLFDAEVQQASQTMYDMSTNPGAYDFSKVRAAQTTLTQKGYNDIIHHYGDLKDSYGAAGIAYFWLLSYQNPASALTLIGGLDIPAGAAGGRGGKPLPIESFTPLRGHNGRYALVTHADAKDVTGRPIEYLVDRQGVLGVGGRVEIGPSRADGLRAGSISPETLLSADPNGLPGTTATPKFIVFPVPPYARQWEVRDANMKSVGFVDAKDATEAQAKAAQKIRALNGLTNEVTSPIYAQPAQPVKTPPRPGTPRATPRTPATDAAAPVEAAQPGKPEPNFVLKPKTPDEGIHDPDFAARAKKPNMQEVANYTADKFLEQDDTRVIMIGENHMYPSKDFAVATANAIKAKSGREVAMTYELNTAWQPIGDAVHAAITPGESTSSDAAQQKLIGIYKQYEPQIRKLIHERHSRINPFYADGKTKEQMDAYYQQQALMTMNNVANRSANGIGSIFIDIDMGPGRNPEYIYYGMRDPSMAESINQYLAQHPGVIVMYAGGSAHCGTAPLTYPEIRIGDNREPFPARPTTATILRDQYGVTPYSVRAVGTKTPPHIVEFYETVEKNMPEIMNGFLYNGYYIDASFKDWKQPANTMDLIVRFN